MESRTCPDCGVEPGERHLDGCDVARCKGCGSQALQCSVHASMPMTVWTGRWPGEVECEELGLWTKFTSGGWEKTSANDPEAVPDLNELGRMHASGEVLWDEDSESLRTYASDNAFAIVGALVRVEPFAWSDDSGPVCGLCGGFSIETGSGARVAHQPGCLLLRAERYRGSLRREADDR